MTGAHTPRMRARWRFDVNELESKLDELTKRRQVRRMTNEPAD
jgi:hypothetical protein